MSVAVVVIDKDCPLPYEAHVWFPNDTYSFTINEVNTAEKQLLRLSFYFFRCSAKK